jgi:hypothetical protein
MKDIDVILAWPNSVDFPLFRKFLRDEVWRFNAVYIVFSQTNQGDDYEEFVRDQLRIPGIVLLDSPPINSEEDWRDVAVNAALEISEAPWVLFLEQDFVILDKNDFWPKISAEMETSDVIGEYDEGTDRLHPSFLLIKRSLVDQTSKYFGVVPDEMDHFGQFWQDLKAIPGGWLRGYLPPNGWSHAAGLSHNLMLLARGEKVTYKPAEFEVYLQLCLAADVKLDPRFVKMVQENLKT